MTRSMKSLADFPDAFRANLWVRGLSDDRTADEALSDFKVSTSHDTCQHKHDSCSA